MIASGRKRSIRRFLSTNFIVLNFCHTACHFLAFTDTFGAGSRALAKVTHMTPLVSIPYLVTQASEKKRGKYLKIGILFAIILCIAGVLLIHLFYKPIDIMWFQLIQKFNLA